ncbi:MAG: bifunctional DNA-formamidopyrimidine glycosylase/DNA-(apurinic or apyrimidinic site) lyase [Firmicutes bacterium]|nr:bifunctional DNA-formamidopyrimidine glycosylase/DNA-(apurinic or apyrimidinic site) lyase [Bacillota bacterium]
MPELPEVETIKTVLIPIVKDAKITGVDVRDFKMIKSDKKLFAVTLIGQTIHDVTRVGKFLIFHLSNDLVLISHLRMEGKYRELLPGDQASKYARIIFSFADGRRLAYDDSRRFGIMKLSTEDRYRHEEPLLMVGPEPFDIKDITSMYAKYQRSGKAVKQMLLDQTVMAGLGNIYADEVLFRCRIHPETPSNRITMKQLQEIVDQSVIVLSGAIKAGGSTVRTYHAAHGIDGTFQTELLAYGRVGEPCAYCQTPLRKIQVGGRGTTFCPRCQRNTALPIVVGITGKIASGKSTVTAMFAVMGYETFSSDDVVHQLYEKPLIKDKISKIFGPEVIVNKRIDRKLLGEKVADNPALKKRLEKFIHPLVKQELIGHIKNAKGSIVFVEVPLLYEAHFDDLCDYVLAVDVSDRIQKRNLMIRHGQAFDLALAINANNAFDSYKDHVDFLITNNSDLASLQKKLTAILKKITR